SFYDNNPTYSTHPTIFTFIETLKQFQIDTYIRIQSLGEIPNIRDPVVRRRKLLISRGLKKKSIPILGTNFGTSGMKTVKTKFEENIVVTMNEEFTAFLPSRIVKYLLKERDQYKLLSDAVTNGTFTIHYIGGQYGESEFLYIETEI
ncbi:hypothetical protein PV327_011533, partial [Microctonus hyperodae]